MMGPTRTKTPAKAQTQKQQKLQERNDFTSSSLLVFLSLAVLMAYYMKRYMSMKSIVAHHTDGWIRGLDIRCLQYPEHW